MESPFIDWLPGLGEAPLLPSPAVMPLASEDRCRMAYAYGNSAVERFVDMKFSSTGSRRRRRAWRCRGIARTPREGAAAPAATPLFTGTSFHTPVELDSPQNTGKAALRLVDSLSVIQRKPHRPRFKHLRLGALPATTLLGGSSGQFSDRCLIQLTKSGFHFAPVRPCWRKHQ